MSKATTDTLADICRHDENGTRHDIVRRGLRAIAFAALGIAVAVNFACVLGLMRTRPQSYGEAEVLFEARRLREHLPLYTDAAER